MAVNVKMKDKPEECYMGTDGREDNGQLILQDRYGNTTARLPLTQVEWWGVTTTYIEGER